MGYTQIVTDSTDSPESGDRLRTGLAKASSLLIWPSETVIIPFPSKDDSRLLVREARVEPASYRELSSCVYALFFLRSPIDRRRDLMQGIEAVMITKYVSIKSQRS